MKHSRFFRIMAAAVILALLMVAIPATPALGATFAISVTSGPPGTPITVPTCMACTGFAEGTGFVWFDTDGDYIMDSGEPYLPATVNSSGDLYAPGTMTVPEVARATYQVRVECSKYRPLLLPFLLQR